jgi:predicted short-subunit dehydrogenase-like oxidoreductase (DUF2520 family)
MRISIIGAGNVGTHLGEAMYAAGHEIFQIHSRDIARARRLAAMISAEAIDTFEKLTGDTDVVVLAVKDDAIANVFKHIQPRVTQCLILHTAGSVSMDVFAEHVPRGVLWPVQSLSSLHPVAMHDVPLAITGDSPETTQLIEDLANTISDLVYRIDDFQRAYLHLAATFANNFSNHMYTLAKHITTAHDIPFDILKPLIRETAMKIEKMSPEEAQTGASVRDDLHTIARHLRLITDHEDLQKLYALLTKSIQHSRKQDS